MSAKIVSKTGVKIPSLWKMKARKKNTEKICAKFVQNPSPYIQQTLPLKPQILVKKSVV